MVLLEIKPIKYSEYKEFAEFTTGMCDYFARRVIRENGIMLGCYVEYKPAAIAMISLNSKSITIYYVNVKESFRKKGLATKLILEAVGIGRQHNKKIIESELVLQHSFGEVLQHILIQSGFSKQLEFICYNTLVNEENQRIWQEFMNKKGQRMIDFAKKRGFTLASFKDVNENILSKIRYGMGTLFPKNLDPFSLKQDLIEDISFIAIKDNNPVAYIAMDYLNKELNVASAAYSAVATNYRKTPAFCLVLFETINIMLAHKNIYKVSSCVSANNKRMIGVYEGMISPMVSSRKDSILYSRSI